MTSEDTVLCLCAQLELDSNEKKYLCELLTTELDWEALSRSAVLNGLLPFLYSTVKHYPDIVPDAPLTALKKQIFTNCARNLLQTGALVKIVTEFQKESIVAIPFKGPLLSILLYDDVGQRSFGDLDILISYDDILQAYEVLLALNYLPELQLTPQKLLRYTTHEDNLSFIHSDNKVIVELHWDLAGAYLASPLLIRELEIIPQQFNVSGCPMPGIANEHLLVYLCVHGAKHKWERLEWISSIAALIRNNQNMNWDSILLFADNKQCRRMLLLGLFLTQTLFNVKLPENILQMILGDKRLPALKIEVTKGIFHGTTDSPSSPLDTRFSFFHIKIRDNLLDSLRYQARLFFRPTNVEWKTITIPAPLSFLYFLIRPIRLFCNTIQRIVG